MNRSLLRWLTQATVVTCAVTSAFSQTPTPTPTPATCTTVPTGISAFTVERMFTPNNISSTTTPVIPSTITSGLTSGALELRENFSFNPQTNIVTITDFAAQPSSSSPTTPANIQASNTLSVVSLTVDKVYFSCQPTPSVLIVGMLSNNYPKSPVGNLNGIPAAISIGYTTDTPPKINNAILVYAGLGSVFSASATGTVTFTSGVVNPPGTNQGGPVIVIGGGNRQSTAQKQITVDLSGSTSPTGLQLTYTITQVSPPGPNNVPAVGASTSVPQSAGIVNLGNTSQITFAGGKGTYAFLVTATDSSGKSASQYLIVDYNGI